MILYDARASIKALCRNSLCSGLQTFTNHQSRRVAEVAADRGEVEGRHRRDEAVHAAIPHRVEDLTIRRDRLIFEALLREVSVHPEEVDQLRRAVDLRLYHRLALAEHSCGVQMLPVLSRHQISYPQPQLQTLLDRLALPFTLRLHCNVDRLLHQLRRRPVILGNLLPVIVRLERKIANSIGEKFYASFGLYTIDTM